MKTRLCLKGMKLASQQVCFCYFDAIGSKSGKASEFHFIANISKNVFSGGPGSIDGEYNK